MKQIVLILCLFPASAFSQNKNVNLLDHWADTSLVTNSSGVRYSGCFYFNYQGREYGVIGSTEGAHVFEITTENKLDYIDSIQGSYVSSQAITKEFGVYGNFLYAIGDEGNASIQVIDLSHLPDSVVLSQEIRDERGGRAHNIYIDSSRALMYLSLVTPIVNGTESSVVPLRVFSIQDPLSPQLIFSGFNDLFEVHDLEVRDEVAILNCGFQGIRVYDFSDPASPVYLNNLEFYQQQGYNHQGSLSLDGKTYVFADETPGTKIKMCTVSADYTIQVQQLFGAEDFPYDKTAHNIEVVGNLAFVAYYNDGLKIYDLRTNPPTEIGAYDTHTDLPGNTFSMWGAWGIEAGISDNRMLLSDRISGFYLFEFDRELFEQATSPSFSNCYPNPVSSGEHILVRSANDAFTTFSITLIDDKGKELFKKEIADKTYVHVPMNFSQGTYFLRIEYPDSFSPHIEIIKLVVI